MKHLYAPWRDDYVKGNIDKTICPFCFISQNENLDITHHVLYRDEFCIAVMNAYPYTPAHFMIIPHTHTSNLEDLETHVWLHITKLAQKGVSMLKAFNASGVNLGMNLGHSGGAGIAEHIHLHLVPRWEKDTNFITTIANTRVYSSDFENIYFKLKELSKDYLKV